MIACAKSCVVDLALLNLAIKILKLSNDVTTLFCYQGTLF